MAALQLRPAPRIDGPYDDERSEPRVPIVDGSLALGEHAAAAGAAGRRRDGGDAADPAGPAA
jgi:hypothetical protein